MQNANQDPNRPRQPNVLPFSASWRCYPGKLRLVTGKLYKLVVENVSFAPIRVQLREVEPWIPNR